MPRAGTPPQNEGRSNRETELCPFWFGAAPGGYFRGSARRRRTRRHLFVRPERAERLRRDGLRVLSPQGDLNLKPRLLVAGAPTEPFTSCFWRSRLLGLSARSTLAPPLGRKR